MKNKVLEKFGHVIIKNSPTILTGLSVTGLVSTAVMAVKATPKAINLLEQERIGREIVSPNDTIDPLTKSEIIKLTWKCYIPAAIMGAVTIGCIVGANSINMRRNAALASLYSLSEVTLKEYQAKVVETIGKNKEQKIKEDIVKDHIDRNPSSKNEVIITGKGETLCYEKLSGRYFKSSPDQIRRVLTDLSRDLRNDMFITLNEVYYGLGLKGTKMGDMLGWHIDDGSIEEIFSSHLTEDDTPCLALDFTVEPRYGYKD